MPTSADPTSVNPSSPLTEEQKAALRAWIETALTPELITQMTSVELRLEFLKTHQGWILTPGQFAGAMLDAGYEIKSDILGTNIKFKPHKP
jgi:hypothetical protein